MMKTAVGLTHSAQHNGCASWSTGAAMNDDVSSLSKLARLQCSQQRTLAVQCTGGTADWGFSHAVLRTVYCISLTQVHAV